MHHVSAIEIDERLNRLRTAMVEQELDGALLHGGSKLFYFSGTAQQAHLWVPLQGEAVLLVRRVLERAEAESPLARIQALTSITALPEALGPPRRIAMELDLLSPSRRCSAVGMRKRVVDRVRAPSPHRG